MKRRGTETGMQRGDQRWKGSSCWCTVVKAMHSHCSIIIAWKTCQFAWVHWTRMAEIAGMDKDGVTFCE